MSDTDGDVARGGHARDGDGAAENTTALRTVIQLTLRTDLRRVIGGCPIEQSGLRENLRIIGAHARRHRLHAEQLLVLIKEVCAALPEARELAHTPEGPLALSQLVTMAVQEYYGPIGAPSSPPA
jgi:hypothetical protein